MRIAYISNNNPEDINNWSGTPCYIVSALRKYHEVDWVGGGVLNGALWHHRFLNKIREVFQDKEKYKSLRKMSRREYETRLNWDAWAQSMNEIMGEIVQSRRGQSIPKECHTKEHKEAKDEHTAHQFFIPVYSFNLQSRPDRLAHLQQQFQGKFEFEVILVEAVKHDVGAIGLWQSICKAVVMAQKRGEDVIILCEKMIMSLHPIIAPTIYSRILLKPMRRVQNC